MPTFLNVWNIRKMCVSTFLPVIVMLFYTLGHAATVMDGTKIKSHWCPTLEVRRVSCVKNVSLGGEPAVLRRVYQWKKELVLQCCPGFMGPNCEKACFSCKQWAEMVGKVHHLEQYLQQGNGPGISNRFNPFTPDQSANTVCWTKDGRPVYANFSPPDYSKGGEQMPGERRGFQDGDIRGRGGEDKMERSRINTRNGASGHSAKHQGVGCPIYSRRRHDEDRYDERSSPYYSSQQTQPENHRRQRQRVSIRMDNPRERQDSLSGRKSHVPMSAKSTHYQRHPPSPDDQKPVIPYVEAGVPLRSSRFSSRASLPRSAMKQIIKRRSDANDDDLEDIRRRYSKNAGAANEKSAFGKRLNTLERQMVELEGKLSALSPALNNVASMMDQIRLLNEQLETLKTRPDFTGNLEHKSSQTVSPKKETFVEPNEKAESRAHDKPHQLPSEKRETNTPVEYGVKKPQFQSDSTEGDELHRSNESSPDCKAQCNDNPAPPLPDKDVVQALFPNDPKVANALEKGPEEFYAEVKKAIKGKKNPDRGGFDFQGQTSNESEHLDKNSKTSGKENGQPQAQTRGLGLDHENEDTNIKGSRLEARLSSESENGPRSNGASFIGTEGLALCIVFLCFVNLNLFNVLPR